MSLQSLNDFDLNGKEALAFVLQRSPYGSIEQTVASLTLFSHPDTVQQVDGQNLFPAVRKIAADDGKRGDFIEHNGERVMIDDNSPPQHAFRWANGLSRSDHHDLQFNHVWQESRNVTMYTSLVNIALAPAFLSKLTDTDSRVRSVLRYRAFDLYEDCFTSAHLSPEQLPEEKPEGYDSLQWAEPLPPVENLEERLRDAMSTKPKNRTVSGSRELGWYFSDYTEDQSLPE